MSLSIMMMIGDEHVVLVRHTMGGYFRHATLIDAHMMPMPMMMMIDGTATIVMTRPVMAAWSDRPNIVPCLAHDDEKEDEDDRWITLAGRLVSIQFDPNRFDHNRTALILTHTHTHTYKLR